MSRPPTVLILLPQVPLVRGGAERQADALCGKLLERGLRADVVTVPFHWEPKETVVREALAWRLLELEADLVVPLKFPAYLVRHPRKVTWLCHQFRQLYEFHGTPLSGFANTPPDHELRESLVELDTRCLRESLAIYTNSRNTAERLRRHNGLNGEPLYPPPPHAERLRCDGYGDFVLAVGRLEVDKRFDLLVRAAAKASPEVTVKIAGTGSQRENLLSLAEELGVAERVELLGWVDEDELINLYAGCRAVHFAPADEDFGLIAIEAMLSQKPVITATDSGGPLEHVSDGENGYVLPPDPQAHAEALDRLRADADLCRSLGERGARDAAAITWDAVLDRLLQWL